MTMRSTEGARRVEFPAVPRSIVVRFRAAFLIPPCGRQGMRPRAFAVDVERAIGGLHMKRLTGIFAGCCCLVSGLGVVAVAQEVHGPPKVLVLPREFLKPGKGGEMHERSESAFVKAMSAAKWPVHYFGVESMSGATRALFLTG